jgi:hypothetical protein
VDTVREYRERDRWLVHLLCMAALEAEVRHEEMTWHALTARACQYGGRDAPALAEFNGIAGRTIAEIFEMEEE